MKSGLKFIRSLVAGLMVISAAGCRTTQTDSLASDAASDATVKRFAGEKQEKVVLRAGVMFSLLVEVDGLNELSVNDLRVRQDGTAVLPMVGEVAVDGLSLSEASDKLSALYSKYYTQKPLIRLQFLIDGDSSPWGYITVLGRVKKPGRVNLPPTRDLTVSGAIQGADGFDSSANLKAVRISRTDANNISSQMIVDMDKIGEGASGKDVQLKAGDVVYVPETIF